MAKRGRKPANPFRDLMVTAVEEPLKGLLKELRRELRNTEKMLMKEISRLQKTVEKLSSKVSAGRSTRVRRKPVSGKRPGRKPVYTKCTYPGCGRPHYAKGFCTRHYQQWRKGKISASESGGK